MNIFETEAKTGMPRRQDPSQLIAKILEKPQIGIRGIVSSYTPFTNQALRLVESPTAILSEREAIDFFNAGKVEKLAYQAILDYYAIEQLVFWKNQAKPYGLVSPDLDDKVRPVDNSEHHVVEQFSSSKPYQEFQIATFATALLAHDSVLEEFKAGVYGDLGLVTLSGLRVWQDFFLRFLPKTDKKQPKLVENPNGYLQQPFVEDDFVGMGTAAKIGVSMLEVIPGVVLRRLGPDFVNSEFLSRTAKNSFTLMTHMAVLDHIRMNAIELALYGKNMTDNSTEFVPFDYYDFNLRPTREGFQMVFEEKVWKNAISILKCFPNGSGETLRGGCPAMARVHGVIPLQRYWGWLVDNAADIYKAEFDILQTELATS